MAASVGSWRGRKCMAPHQAPVAEAEERDERMNRAVQASASARPRMDGDRAAISFLPDALGTHRFVGTRVQTEMVAAQDPVARLDDCCTEEGASVFDEMSEGWRLHSKT